MWPFISANDVDWAATAQMLTALGAVGALIWSVWWSHTASQREALAKIAAYRVSWIEELRKLASELTALLANIVDQNNPSTRSDVTRSHQISDEIKMRIRGQEYTQCSDKIREMIDAHLMAHMAKTTEMKDLERCAKLSFEFAESISDICQKEWQRAKAELSGVNKK